MITESAHVQPGVQEREVPVMATRTDVRFRFDSGRPSLDFLATVGNRGGLVPNERLASPARWSAWLVESGMMPAALDVDGRAYADAISLREAMQRIVRAVLLGDPAGDADVRAVNTTAAGPRVPPPELRVTSAGDLQVELASARSLAEAKTFLALDLLDLLSGPLVHSMRMCSGEHCEMAYLDTSRGTRRKWCSSAVCGNRSRVSQHRERRRDGDG
ncbi:CGNR zinc finger domain-containing protein [Amycolatopsis sp. H20-H5]|uniref:CGNR zinc finger domain-containing protein n=1 Tax=Amycolatopsis sp. H20-H5 TaxID=3046309 RepID=UPI002DBEEBFD|nr:CGNR zinc finger domain-containing protein [Amycolatopsis sp. H20-H5]MEC3978519.1 CGNR zinc finger domain-containing protein [Amycolatopsis sp. H20-H5]